MANINRKYLLDKRPTGMPEDECWKLVEEETVPLKSGEIFNPGKIFIYRSVYERQNE